MASDDSRLQYAAAICPYAHEGPAQSAAFSSKEFGTNQSHYERNHANIQHSCRRMGKALETATFAYGGKHAGAEE